VARFSGNETPYLGVPVLEGPKGSGVVAMLDASTVIAGERAEVQAAIGRRGAGAVTTARDAALATTVASLRERYDTWAVGDGPANLVPASARPDGLDAIDHFQFGISLSHGLELAAEVHVASAKDVE